MSLYTTENGHINLNDYKLIKGLNTGNTNLVELWQHKMHSDIQIVVKTPTMFSEQVIPHNIKVINEFFGPDYAWPVQNKSAFAMRFIKGKQLTEEDFDAYDIVQTATFKNQYKVFTILDPNSYNFLKASDGSLIPIDFDYVVSHQSPGLEEYMIEFLDHRVGFRIRVADSETWPAIEDVLESYVPSASEYLREHWVAKKYGKKYENEIAPVLVARGPKLAPKQVDLMNAIIVSLTDSISFENIDALRHVEKLDAINSMNAALNEIRYKGCTIENKQNMLTAVANFRRCYPTLEQEALLNKLIRILLYPFNRLCMFFNKPQYCTDKYMLLDTFEGMISEKDVDFPEPSMFLSA